MPYVFGASQNEGRPVVIRLYEAAGPLSSS